MTFTMEQILGKAALCYCWTLSFLHSSHSPASWSSVKDDVPDVPAPCWPARWWGEPRADTGPADPWPERCGPDWSRHLKQTRLYEITSTTALTLHDYMWTIKNISSIDINKLLFHVRLQLIEHNIHWTKYEFYCINCTF